MDVQTWVITVSKVIFFAYLVAKADLLGCMTQCVWHLIPLILHFHGENIFSLHSHRKWHYVLWIAWILWWSTELKWCSNVSDFTLRQSNALMRLCHSIPAKCNWQLGFFPGVKQKKQHQEYDKCVKNIMFFLREAPFLVVFCWLWGKKVTEKTRGDKRQTLFNETRKYNRAGSLSVAGSLILGGVFR